MTLTLAQKRVLLSMPADGSWRTSNRFWSTLMKLMRVGYVQRMTEGYSDSYRLTPAGIEARKELEKDDD